MRAKARFLSSCWGCIRRRQEPSPSAAWTFRQFRTGRAATANPAVLLLDEITANLDAETEQRVLAALRRACEGRTVLSVSHRIYENLGGRTIEIGSQRNAALSHV